MIASTRWVAWAAAIALAAAVAPNVSSAQRPASPAPAARRDTTAPRDMRLDSLGVIRWRADGREVALFGANYTLPSASDFRAAGYLGADRKRMIDDDMAHFARMGWDGLRLASWGDWESADTLGNLIPNEHLDLLDYLVAKASKRGIRMLLTPIQTYDAGWPDALASSPRYPGFSRKYARDVLGTDPAAIRAQSNYLRQFLEHVNPYTRVALKDEPAIVFIEMINEPVHHPEDAARATAYIDTLVAAVRRTGARQLLFHNLSQDFTIADAIARSRVQGVTFGWYPTGLVSGHELPGNYLRSVDDYAPMRDPLVARMPRIVYEFDSADLQTGVMYPAMARAFRGVGAQFASMFAYDMLATASRNLGWQTHHLNLVYTPRKAMSAVLASEAMRRLPSGISYGRYPVNTTFGDFRLHPDSDLAELLARDAFIYTGSTTSTPVDAATLRRVAGVGSSAVVQYEGEGAYFLDRIRAGVWRLEVYPDAVPIRDPFESPAPDKIVTRAIYRRWPMTVHLPDLGEAFTVTPLSRGAARGTRATSGGFEVRPGVYVLSRNALARGSLQATIGLLGMAEFHAPPKDDGPLAVTLVPQRSYVRGAPMHFMATVIDTASPDTVALYIRPVGGWFRRYPMHRAAAYRWQGIVPADSMPEGSYEYAISVARGRRHTLFPDASSARPHDWDFHARSFWRTTVVLPGTPLRLLDPAEDAPRLAFSRIGDGGRAGIVRVVASGETGNPALHLSLPARGEWAAESYSTSLVVRDRVTERGSDLSAMNAVRIRFRGIGPRPAMQLALVEQDGTAWGTLLTPDTVWTQATIPLSLLVSTRVAMLPQGFPGTWNATMGPATGRGGFADHLRPMSLERLQLTLVRPTGAAPRPDEYGVEVESITLVTMRKP